METYLSRRCKRLHCFGTLNDIGVVSGLVEKQFDAVRISVILIETRALGLKRKRLVKMRK